MGNEIKCLKICNCQKDNNMIISETGVDIVKTPSKRTLQKIKEYKKEESERFFSKGLADFINDDKNEKKEENLKINLNPSNNSINQNNNNKNDIPEYENIIAYDSNEINDMKKNLQANNNNITIDLKKIPDNTSSMDCKSDNQEIKLI